MDAYYYGILRKYAEELKIKQLKDNSQPSTISSTQPSTISSTQPSTISSTQPSTPLPTYNKITPLVCNQTNSVSLYRGM